MPPDAPLSDPTSAELPVLLVLFVATTAILSLGACAAVVTRWRRGADPLPYEPRRPVPWTGLEAGLLVLLGLTVPDVVTVLVLGIDGSLAEMASPAIARLLLLSGISKLIFILFATAMLVLRTGAQAGDLGLATRAAQRLADVRLGMICFFIALAPVYAIQIGLLALQSWLGWEPALHPIGRVLTEDPSMQMLAVSIEQSPWSLV